MAGQVVAHPAPQRASTGDPDRGRGIRGRTGSIGTTEVTGVIAISYSKAVVWFGFVGWLYACEGRRTGPHTHAY